jgi:malonate decarboxylase delta subunit
MEHLHFRHAGQRALPAAKPCVVGVVASGNLEVLIEAATLAGACEFDIRTPARGFEEVWAAVIADFVARHPCGDVRVSINDNAATPGTVALRLAQAIEEYAGPRRSERNPA